MVLKCTMFRRRRAFVDPPRWSRVFLMSARPVPTPERPPLAGWLGVLGHDQRRKRREYGNHELQFRRHGDVLRVYRLLRDSFHMLH